MMPMSTVGSVASMPQQLTHINTDGLFIKVWGITDKDKADFFRDMIEVYNAKLAEGFGQLRSQSELVPGKIVLAFYNNQFQRAEIVQMDNSPTRKVIVFLLDLGVMTSVDMTEIRLADGIFGAVPRTGLAEEFILQGVIARKPWSSQEVESVNLCLRHCTEITLTGIVGDKKIILVVMSMNAQARINLSTFLVEGGLADSVSDDQLTNALRNKFSKTSSFPMNQFSVPPPTIPNVPIPSNFVTPQQSSVRGPSVASMYTNDLPQPSLSHSYQRIRAPKPVQSVQSVPAVQSYVYQTLPVDSTHDVVVSHVIDGMNAFTVQLKKSTDIDLPKLMAKINDIRPVPITEQIGPGALCLGRFVQDTSLCRAVVSNVLAEGASLYFVDFGNTEIVPFNEIYRIPPEFLQEPTMALRFTLADLTNNYPLTTIEAQAIFTNLVLQEDLCFKLKVVKPLVPTQQRCELFLVTNGKAVNIKNKILDKVKLMKPVEYKKINFKKNQVADVTVTFAESPLRFFIQLELNQEILEVIMKCVEDYCLNSENKDILYTEDIVENMAVCAPYEDDRYYRGLIVDEPDSEGNITVFYVDYGNSDTVHYSKLRIMNNEMMSQFPTQAIECRLDIDPTLVNNEKVATTFIELADGENFKMTVKNILPAHVLLVDLIDQNGRNLADHLKETLIGKSSPGGYAAPSKAPLQKSSSGNWREKNGTNMESDFSSFRDEKAHADSRDDRPRSDSNSNHFRSSHDDRTGRGRNYESKRRDSEGIDTIDEGWKKSNDFWGRDKGPKSDTKESWRHDNFNSDQTNDKFSAPRDRNDNRGTFRKRDEEGDTWNSRNNQDDNRAGGERRFDKGGQGGRSRDWDNKTSDDEFGGRPKRDGGFRDRDKGNDFGNRPPRRDDGFSDRPPRRDGGFNDRPPRRDDGFNNERPPRRDNRSNDGGFSNDSAWDDKNSKSWDTKEQTNDSGWGSGPSNDRGGRRDFGNDRGGSFGDDSRGKRDGGFRKRDDNFSSNSDNRGPRKWNDDFGSRNTVTLLDGFDKGAQIVDAEYQPGQELDSVIPWFINPVNFYIIANNNTEFRQLMEKIQSEYPNRKTLDTNDLSANDHVVARDKTNVIYRATVLRTSPRGVVVTFVDYGNTETVAKNQVWAISPDHCLIPKQAIQCGLHNITSSNENGVWKATSEYDAYFGKDNYKATLMEKVDQDGSMIWMVNLTDLEGQDVADQLVANNLALRKVILSSHELYDIDLFVNQTISVFTAAVISSKKFFVHIEPDKADHIATYIQELTENPAKLVTVPVESILPGEFCLAPSSDEQYYRALILSTNSDEKEAHVAFIDYGDEYDVSFDMLKILPDYLKIYNPQAVECCLYDSESFTNEDDFIQNIEEKDFMIKVMKVQDNVLHVKLFDVKGTALPYPVESNETVPVICEASVLRPIENVLVSSVTSNKAFLQRPSDQSAVIELNNSLSEKYDSDVAQEKVDIEVGKFYAAKSGQFEAWYRCRLLEPESDKIFYIDYGNTEPIDSLLAIRPLDEEFYNVPMCCFGVSTDADISAESIETLMAAIQEIIFKAVIKNVSSDASPSIELFADLCTEAGKTFADYVVELESGSKRASEPETIYNAFENWNLNDSKNVMVSAVSSPIQFYLMLKEDNEKLNKLQEDLQNVLKTVLPMVGNTDTLCAVKSANDNKWYRCYQADNVAVDFGLVIEPLEYKKLPAKYLFIRDKYVIQCRLDVASPTIDWNKNTLDTFKDLVKPENDVLAKLEAIKDGKMIVDLISNGTSVTETLMTDGLVKYQGYGVVISHAVSLTEFYIQDESTQDDLFDLLAKLKEGAETWEKVVPEEGQIVAAQFPDDDEWYRAKVISIVDDAITVFFIDYGNQSVCTEFRVLPEDISEMPKFASHCSAHPLPENADELKEKFVAFVDAHAEEQFEVYFLNRHSEPVLVMLYFGGELIDTYLVEKKEQESPRPCLEFKNVSVVHINSPSSFYVQTETPLLDEIADRLDAVESTEEAVTNGMTVGTLYAAKFLDDGVWYRAKAITTNEVLFIDFGNTAVVEEVRNLPADLNNMPFLAKHCAIKSPPGLDEWPQVATERFSELTCDGNTVFTMNIVEEGDPAFVQMVDNGVNVTDELYMLCKAELTAPSNVNDKPSVIISYVNNLNEIWIQEQTPALDELCDELSNVESFDALELSSVEPGAIVAALFDEDGVWYRAKILEKSDEGCKVLFIDYGNQSDITKMKSLPEDLAGMPAFATKSRLLGIPDDAATTWPSSVLDKVKEISENAEVFVLLDKEIKDDVTYVSLQSDGAIELNKQLIEMHDNEEQPPTDTTNEVPATNSNQLDEVQTHQTKDETAIDSASELESQSQNDIAEKEQTQDSALSNSQSDAIVESSDIQSIVEGEHDTVSKSKVDSISENKETCVVELDNNSVNVEASNGDVPSVPSPSPIVENGIKIKASGEPELANDIDTSTENVIDQDVAESAPSQSSVPEDEATAAQKDPSDVDTTANESNDSHAENILDQGDTCEVTQSSKNESDVPAVDDQIADEKISTVEKNTCEAVQAVKVSDVESTSTEIDSNKDGEKAVAEDEEEFYAAESSPCKSVRSEFDESVPEEAFVEAETLHPELSQLNEDEGDKTIEVEGDSTDEKITPTESTVSKIEGEFVEAETLQPESSQPNEDKEYETNEIEGDLTDDKITPTESTFSKIELESVPEESAEEAIETSPSESITPSDVQSEEPFKDDTTSEPEVTTVKSSEVETKEEAHEEPTNDIIASEQETSTIKPTSPIETTEDVKIEDETNPSDDLDGLITSKAESSCENITMQEVDDFKVTSNDDVTLETQSTPEPSEPAEYKDTTVDEGGSDESSSTITPSETNFESNSSKVDDQPVEIDHSIEETSKIIDSKIVSDDASDVQTLETNVLEESSDATSNTIENTSQPIESADLKNESKTDDSIVQSKDDSEIVAIKIEAPVESSTDTSTTIDAVSEIIEVEEPKVTALTVSSDEEKKESIKTNETKDESSPCVVESDRSSVQSVHSSDASKSESVYLSMDEDVENDYEKASLDVSLGSCSTFVGEIESESLLSNYSNESDNKEPEPTEKASLPSPEATTSIKSTPPGTETATKPRIRIESPRKLFDGNEYTVMCVDNPGNFYVQRVSDSKFIKSIEKHLKKAEKTNAVVKEAKIGSIYGAKMGNSWFRVKVLDSDPFQGYNIFCVDYGNEVSVKKLFNLPEELLAIAPFATCCGIPLPAHLTKWPLDVSIHFEELTLLNNPVFKLQRVVAVEEGEIQMVNLTNDEIDVWQVMKEMCVKYEDESDESEFLSPEVLSP